MPELTSVVKTALEAVDLDIVQSDITAFAVVVFGLFIAKESIPFIKKLMNISLSGTKK